MKYVVNYLKADAIIIELMIMISSSSNNYYKDTWSLVTIQHNEPCVVLFANFYTQQPLNENYVGFSSASTKC